MSTVLTTNFLWRVPVPGTEIDLWGGILNNAIGAPGAPVDNIDADLFAVKTTADSANATAQTANNTANAALPKAGGTMTGFLTLNNDPNGPLVAAPRQYVDALADRLTSQYLWDDSTIMADPGNGNIRGNNILLGSCTQFAVSATRKDGTPGDPTATVVGDAFRLSIASSSARFRLVTIVNNTTWVLITAIALINTAVNPVSGDTIALVNYGTEPVVTEAPADSVLYGRLNGAWSSVTAAISTAVANKSDRGVADASTVITGAHTLALADAGGIVQAGGTVDYTITIPQQSSVTWADRTRIDVVRTGTAEVTISPGSGVTLNSALAKRRPTSQYSGVTLYRTSSNVWVLMGDIKT